MWRFALRKSIPRRNPDWLVRPALAGFASVAVAWHLWGEEENQVCCESRLVMPPDIKPHLSSSRRESVQYLQEHSASSDALHDKYIVDWDQQPLGVGSFGSVHLATVRKTNEKVAIKKIPKELTDGDAFDREIKALLHLRQAGGHPYICSLRDNFVDDNHYYLVLDLITGGEMFDHLVEQGSYSEMDASRLVREVASALAYLHGLGTTHGDMKPENLMLSTRSPSDATIKLVDFGCAIVEEEERLIDWGLAPADEDEDFVERYENDKERPSDDGAGFTVAYCPPEVLEAEHPRMSPAMDVWALGIILYIMLTGSHPFDLRGEATDDEIEQNVVSGKMPPLRNSSITMHLSESAIDLIEKLLERDPKKRLTALEMLEHPWVKGRTAKSDAMTSASKKLSHYRAFKTKISAKVFEHIVNWSDDNEEGNNVSKRVSLIERSFREFDTTKRGYITKEGIEELIPDTKSVDETPRSFLFGRFRNEPSKLSLSGFSDLLAENMENEYFPKRHVVYKEGEIGNHMYFINSGTVSVETDSGSVDTRGPGDFFGEGALLSPTKKRSATIRCVTPVHAIVISREYFDKYLATSGSSLELTLREKDNIRKRDRAKMILRLQKNLREMKYRKNQKFFTVGQEGDFLFLLESGSANIEVNGKKVFGATAGNIFGEYSPLTGRRRNCSAVCTSDEGCKVQRMKGKDFRNLLSLSPETASSLRDLCIRRDFKKAVIRRLNRDFPYDNPREAFDEVRTESCPPDGLSDEAIEILMRELNPNFTEDEIQEIIRTVDMSHTGSVTYAEFVELFMAELNRAAAA